MVGAVGAMVAALTELAVHKLRIDDPVGVVAVHGACGVWGLLAVGRCFLIISKLLHWNDKENQICI